MKRVASLYLPHWAIDRVVRAARRQARPPETVDYDPLPLKRQADAERAGTSCDAPRNSGWRPGARWARQDAERQIAALPAHQRPPMREMGRRSEAAEMPFRRLPGDDGGKSAGWPEPAAPPVRPSAKPQGDRAAVPSARDRPAEGEPALLTVRKTGGRVEVAAVSPAAAALGIAPGMALTQARAMVPHLDVHEDDPAGDRAALLGLATALARRWCPIVAIADDPDPLHPGEGAALFLDLTGTAHLHGGEGAMAARIVRVLARLGIAARMAVADTAGAAWAVARHSAGAVTIVAPGAHAAAIAPLPADALRLGEGIADRLRRLGLDTIGALLALPRAPLVRRFGPRLAMRLDQATGAAAEPLDPVVPVEPIVVERRFAEPIATAEAIGFWLDPIVADLVTRLAQAGSGARALVFAVTRVDGAVQAIRIGLARPSRDGAHILRLIARRIAAVEPGHGIDALAIHVHRADPLAAQPIDASLADGTSPAGGTGADLAPLVDTLANRIGPARQWRVAPVESDVPERAVGRRMPLDPPAAPRPGTRQDDVALLDARAPDHPWHPRWPRPARLLPRPEPIDHVLAELPDQHPRRFRWRGIEHRIVRGDGPERIHGEWWRRASERDRCRDYFRVEDESGRRFWLFRHGDGMRPETGDLSWYMHGTFG